MLFTSTLPQLDHHADRVRWERYARMLDYNGVHVQSTRLSEELSYNYRLEWSFVTIVFYTHCLFYLVLSYRAKSEIEVLVHKWELSAMFIEIHAMVVFEVLWRYFRLDLES